MVKFTEAFNNIPNDIDRAIVKRASFFAEGRADGNPLSIEQQEALANGFLVLWDRFCIEVDKG